jgi:uncharacterized repeat protein (TIGR01451 family)
MTAEPDLGDNTATTTTLVGIAEPDVSVIKVDMPDPVPAGSNLTYTINVTNTGPSDAQTVGLNDRCPPARRSCP